jgi:histidinol-phosphate aminotransferase
VEIGMTTGPGIAVEGILDLSDNTNLYGVPPAALRVLRETSAGEATRYPSPQSDDLRAALANYAGVTPERVSTGCGSDDVLDSIVRTFASPGERLAFCDPTFSMIPELARRNRLVPCPVRLAADFDIDDTALLAAGAPLLYLCSPNNPTGTVASRERIERVLDGARGIVVLDEAYAEFSGTSLLAETGRRRDLLVVRTLSKAFGLAGLRVGYAIGDPDRIARVEETRGPYKVGSIAERAAAAALREDRSWVADRAAQTGLDRERLIAALTAIGLAPLPSAANFVLVPVPDAAACAARMRAAGVHVRAFPGLAGIGDAVRMTVAGPAVIQPAVAALREALS